jgi:electron transfer flavoprotein alpha subunit
LGARIISSELYELTSDITEAVAIVCGGAGCRTKDNFNELIIPLAESLGKFLGEKAIVAASRAAVELGFIEHSRQVGQTGQTVKPRVYVAVGVSGAVQHLTGMQNSDIIVAINNDPNAPIFKVADYGMVGNMDKLVPQLIDALSSQVDRENNLG